MPTYEHTLRRLSQWSDAGMILDWNSLDDPEAREARVILEAVSGRNPMSFTAREFDAIDRACAGVLAVLRKAKLQNEGYTLRRWDRRGPDMERGDYGQVIGPVGDFYDHVYRLVGANDRRPRYVSEPYTLDDQDIRHLARLIDDGWHVSIGGRWAMHFPGRTVAVVLRPSGKREVAGG